MQDTGQPQQPVAEISIEGLRKNGSRKIICELRNQMDKLWIDFWTGGIANPLSVIE